MSNNKRQKPKKKLIIPAVIAGVISGLILGFVIYVSIYYHPDDTALAAMNSDGMVTVTETVYGWLFDGPSEDTALIFYPGAKVDARSYAPILHNLASQGIDVCLVNMPLRFAINDINAADKAINEHQYTTWYMCGHSMGGFCAEIYAAGHSDTISGIIMLGAFPTSRINDGMKVLLITGSEDEVINRTTYSKNLSLLPADYLSMTIPGGNHAQFGNYGIQNGDGTATITAAEQQDVAIRAILSLVNS